jgi:hypothetical protein
MKIRVVTDLQCCNAMLACVIFSMPFKKINVSPLVGVVDKLTPKVIVIVRQTLYLARGQSL